MRNHLLLTGGTGMVGSYVMAECLREGTKLVVLARGKAKQSASQRVEQILRRFEESWQIALPRPRVFDCDLNQAGLGLSTQSSQWIETHCEQILHSAASLSFAPASQSPDDEPYRTNVDGTTRVLEFCRNHLIRHFHHVSTAYVCGKRSGTVKEAETDVGQLYANDYERSKTLAEGLVRKARQSGQLDSLTIFRPSIVIDRTGLSPISGDRTIYGAFSMYQMLASRFGLPEHGQWFRNLGFGGDERKNIVDVDWIAKAIRLIVTTPRYHGSTYHLTTKSGTSVADLDAAFHIATQQWLARPSRVQRKSPAKLGTVTAEQQAELDRMAAPFVQTFLPYFRDDPTFARDQIDRVVSEMDLEPTPEIGTNELLEMVRHWSPLVPKSSADVSEKAAQSDDPAVSNEHDLEHDLDEIVICGYEVRLPGGVENANDFERMLWEGRSGIEVVPPERLDRALYFDSAKGLPGKTYTQLGGCVASNPLNPEREREISALGHFDLTHRQFAHVAMAAVESVFGTHRIDQLAGVDPTRAGILVGHSGGTELGGPLAMSSLAPAAAESLHEIAWKDTIDPTGLQDCQSELVALLRQNRPRWQADGSPHFNAYSVASLAGSLIGFQGRREVIDAACSSSLLALQHAVTAMKADRMDMALVGGATFNNVDNLALFSQSGACSDEGCYPFDRRASGLISSEGYVAVVLVRRRLAEQLNLPIHAAVVGVGIASDGKGKGLWAPRSEGQQLAIRRANVPPRRGGDDRESVLDVDYLECHATSTQVGDATELETLTALLRSQPERPIAASGSSSRSKATRLPIGSAKSNLGHLLEAAGLVGMVKCLIAMKNAELPPSIHFKYPNDSYQWEGAPLEVVDSVRPWPQRNDRPDRVAGVNAFGIGGLNAHAVIRQTASNGTAKHRSFHLSSVHSNSSRDAEPIAIVGRGAVLPGVKDINAFTMLLRSNRSLISDPPTGRWPMRADGKGWIGVGENGISPLPHCRGGYIEHFHFDAQSYRIPPKTIQFANPAQLMLIQATAETLHESGVTDDPARGTWTIDRKKIGVVIGTIFGGEFSNSLQVGLRLPEIEKHFHTILQRRGVESVQATQWMRQLHDALMDRYPALLDETGGFTASTLASRIARTFDLMGGACAVDADEASGGLAVITAAEQLRDGHVDAVLCGVSHRSMDIVAYEQLHQKNQLVESGRPEDVPNDGSQIFPGEGVAIMMLQRLSDAVAQGRPVFGILQGESETWAADVRKARRDDARRSQSLPLAAAPKLVSQIGHLGGGQGIVRTIAATIAFQQTNATTTKYDLSETAQDGFQVNYQIAPPPMSNSMNHSFSQSGAGADELCSGPRSVGPQHNERNGKSPKPSQHEVLNKHAVSGNHTSSDPLIRIRLQATDFHPMEQALHRLMNCPGETVGSSVSRFTIPHESSVRPNSTSWIQAAIVGRNADEISRAARALLDGPVRQRHTSALAKECGWLRVCGELNESHRVGWLFPGQGSQYSAVPSLLDRNGDADLAARAQTFLDDIDSRLRRRGIEPIGPRLHDPQRQLGRDVWWTQLWVLAVGAAMTDSLRARGHRPDVVLGHSFGECNAAWAAGVMDIDQAIEFAKCRSDAVVMTRQIDGELLSVRGEPSAVQAVLNGHQLQAVISHHNSPTNTVIAGSRGDIAKAKGCLSEAGLASVVISVPAAFHTPRMKPAQELLRARYGGQRLLPPRCSFLSAVSNRYLAEPIDLMDNLIDQLTKPVCFHGALERIVREGCGLLIEVGPENVLTRLARATVDGRAICLSADDRKRDFCSQQALVDLACEAFRGRQTEMTFDHSVSGNGKPHSINSADSTRSAPIDSNEAITPKRFEVVDLTRRRRRSGAPALNAATTSTNAASSNTVESPVAVPSSVAVQPTPITQTQVAATSQTTIDRQAARSFLFDLVVDLTGYDPEIIEFDADLEAELGVDSIKKAQLIGEMVQWANVPIDTQAMQLARFETLNDIISILPQSLSSMDSIIDSRSHPGETVEDSLTLVEDSPTNETQGKPTTTELDSLHRLIIDLVVDQTGYDESIIDMDADMEGELGIDSIKKAQLLGELEQQYQLQSIRESNLTLAEFSTLGSIRDFVWQKISTASDSQSGSDPPQKKNESEAEVVTFDRAALVPSTGTHRFELRTHHAPRLDAMPTHPNWHGPAVVLGENAIADAIVARWHQDHESSVYPIHTLSSSSTADELETKLNELWDDCVSPHLFITTPHDSEATWRTDDTDAWQSRRQAALLNPFRVCQRWMQGRIDLDAMSHSSLVTVVRGGGSFGFRSLHESSSDTNEVAVDANKVTSAESGGVAGLTKAMLIEAWMRGHRDTPMLVIDPIATANTVEIVEGVWRELATPSYDEEVIVAGAERLSTCARYQPISESSCTSSPTLSRGGTWVVAGGGRGITAMTAMELAARHGLKLHLLGTAPVPKVDEQIRQSAEVNRGDLRRRVMTQVQAKGGNPVTTWQKLEKAIEIDQTLQACRQRSIEATYHSVDVSDAGAVEDCLQKIREVDGPIHGVIQGAGAGQDARFDRKRPDKVEKCFRAKIDGCISLAAATRNDPLEWFIGFGSISGRFGANGHTDYSAANDMLAKLISQLKRQRPQTRCVTFHWHAWGDVGMATKPEAKLALDMIGMEFMPANEGLQHFLNEVEHGGDLTEVLITDRQYVRKFFPQGEADESDDNGLSIYPLLDPECHRLGVRDSGRQTESSYAITLNPTRDRFLNEHLVHGRPTLPFVVAIEMLAEAARVHHAEATGKRLQAITCHDVRAHQPLKCLTDDAFAVELVPAADDAERWSLVSDLRRRDGRLVQAARPHFSASIQLGAEPEIVRWSASELSEDRPLALKPVVYQPTEASVYHGPQLQCLREIAFDLSQDQDVLGRAVGAIVTPSPAHLAGEQRPLRGWSISPASVDAMLYAAGCLAYRMDGRPSLPISFDRIRIGRLPRPGEILRVVVEVKQANETGGTLSAKLAGQNRDRIVQLDGYRIGWLG